MTAMIRHWARSQLFTQKRIRLPALATGAAKGSLYNKM
jgi:hypothetical protein